MPDQPNKTSQLYGYTYDPFCDQIIVVPMDPTRVYLLLGGLIVGVKEKPHGGTPDTLQA